jgi:hypothetical protein
MQRTTARRVLTPIAAATAVLLALVAWILATRHDDPGSFHARAVRGHASPRGSSASADSIRPLSTDPATPPLEWGREEVMVTVPDEVPGLQMLVDDDESLEDLMDLLEWSMAAGQGGTAGLEMAQCAARFEPRLEGRCSWEIQAVLHRTGSETGQIVHARATVTSGAEQAACRAFASCWSEVWATRDPAPMPGRAGDELVFSQRGRSSMWEPSRGVDAIDHYRGLASSERRRVAALETAARGRTSVTPSSLGWNMLFARNAAEEAECMVEVIERRQGACGP